MQQILKETKIKYIYFTNDPPYPTYEKNNVKEILIQNNVIITNPLNYKSGVKILAEDNLQFEVIALDTNYVEILSEKIFYLRINNSFLIKTKHFNYLNPEDHLISLEVLNGGCLIDNLNNITPGPVMEEIKLEYIIATGI
jgi:hypothetical protein